MNFSKENYVERLIYMIKFDRLWNVMEQQHFPKNKLHELVGGGTYDRLRKNESVSTNTLDFICKTLKCTLYDIVEYIPEDEEDT